MNCRNSAILSLLSLDVCVCSFLCLKLYSLNFAIAHAQKRFLCLSEFVILVLHKYTRKLSYHLKQAQKINFEFINFLKKNVKCLPFTKTDREYQIFGNLLFITIFDNFLSFVKPGRPISTLFLPFLDQ